MQQYSDKKIRDTSKLLSLLLRHQPEAAHLTIDIEGWVIVEHLITNVSKHFFKVDRPLLETVVAQNAKKRFAFSADGQKIRASQGHSINVELGMEVLEPPQILFHGTATRFLESILSEGIQKMSRQHVHLSDHLETAQQVGQRHGKIVVLHVRALDMHLKGHKFFRSANGVWLTDFVPCAFIDSAKV